MCFLLTVCKVNHSFFSLLVPTGEFFQLSPPPVEFDIDTSIASTECELLLRIFSAGSNSEHVKSSGFYNFGVSSENSF